MQSSNWEGYRKVAWVGVGLLVIAIGVVVVQANWLGLAFLAGFLIASVIFLKLDHRLPTLFDLIFVSAAVLNAAGCAWDLYNKPGLYDEVAHFYTILAMTLSFGFLLYRELMGSFSGHRLLFIVTIASLGIAIGALWEIFEWLIDFATPKQIVSGLFDTITDLMLDSAGATLAALLNLWGLHELARSDMLSEDQRRARRARSLPEAGRKAAD